MNPDDPVEWALRRLRRGVCLFICFAGAMFAIGVIETQPTWVGMIGGTFAVTGSIFAVASLVASVKQYAVERMWMAIGLAAFSVVFVIAVSVL